MKIAIRPDAEAVAALAAHLIAAQLAARPDSVLGLATGRTMERVYARLVGLHEATGFEIRHCTCFNLDEYIGLEPQDPHSYRRFMDRHLFDLLPIARDRTHLPDGLAADLAAEAARYEQAIRASGGIDLQVLGLGETGHIGFNEPLSSFASRTRDVTLAPRTRTQNAALFDGVETAVPARAMTMGVATILEARRILLVVTGTAKAAILARAIEGPMTASISGSALQLHPDCLVLADEPAAAALAERTFYDHLAATDPDLLALPG